MGLGPPVLPLQSAPLCARLMSAPCRESPHLSHQTWRPRVRMYLVGEESVVMFCTVHVK
ncbi:hypothetical protein NDU88_006933 [Pleurodeles waltl]|uniref:Uncharacterized protein n=1 Tax=Pleurodeles waltl TaxID=8319 RepID=A0AAV7LTZ7_PLEWA|nr:hypothetical protein NDU88_006933 [Pleurodeles waltl]